MTRTPLASVACFLLAAGCGVSHDFRLRFGDEIEAHPFNCETQGLHHGRTPVIRPVPEGQGPSDKMMGLDPGPDTVAWLYHFNDDGDALRDDDFAYSIALVLRNPSPGRIELPSDGTSILFFCDNWGRGFRACEARIDRGWLVVRDVEDRVLSGEFDVRLRGEKERPDGSRESIEIHLEGRFRATR